MNVSSILRKRFIFFFTEFRLANQKIRTFFFFIFLFFFLLTTFSDKPPKLIYMAYGRTPLKRRTTYGRGTKQYRRTVYRRAYFNSRRGIGRKEKKGCDIEFPTATVVDTTNDNSNTYLLNGIQKGLDHGTESGDTSGTNPSNWTSRSSGQPVMPPSTRPKSMEAGSDAWSSGTNNQTMGQCQPSTPSLEVPIKLGQKPAVYKTTSSMTTCSDSKSSSTQ